MNHHSNYSKVYLTQSIILYFIIYWFKRVKNIEYQREKYINKS